MRFVATIVLAVSYGLLISLTGCSSVSVPALSGGMGLAGTPSSQGALRSAGTRQNIELAQAVPLDSSGKAPKGALADRDYGTATLDPQAALEAVNTYRQEKGLGALKLDARLTAAAKAHSRDLANGDRISHYGSDGSSPWDRVARTGYQATLAAENVGTGQASMLEVIKGWKGSEAHNKNLLLPDAEDMGIALVLAPKSEFKTFWTLVVGTSER
jgi:uncharacterized protein YkwD